jgi:hypothetical protein
MPPAARFFFSLQTRRESDQERARSLVRGGSLGGQEWVASGLARTSPGRRICRARAAACCPCTAAAAVLWPAATWDTLRWLLVHRHSLETSAQRTHIPARGSVTGSNFCAQCDTIQVRNLSSGRQRRGGRPRRQLRPPGGARVRGRAGVPMGARPMVWSFDGGMGGVYRRRSGQWARLASG